MRMGRLPAAIGALAVAAVGLTGCRSFTAADTASGAADTSSGAAATASGASTSAPTASTAPSAVGIPSGPAYYTSPEPSSVASDPPAPTPPPTGASVFVTYAQWDTAAAAVELAGYLSGAEETDGECTLALSKGPLHVSTTAPATPDATSTSCGQLSVAGSRLAPGTWTAVLSYRSRRTAGSSDPVEVTVP